MFFYQIYAELKEIKKKNAELEELLLDIMKTATKTKKREEGLHLRVNTLEERNRNLEKEIERLIISKGKTEQEIELIQDTNNELFYKHNEMFITINAIITELNLVIANLNSNYKEN